MWISTLVWIIEDWHPKIVDIHVDIRRFLKIHAWIGFGFSDQGLFPTEWVKFCADTCFVLLISTATVTASKYLYRTQSQEKLQSIKWQRGDAGRGMIPPLPLVRLVPPPRSKETTHRYIREKGVCHVSAGAEETVREQNYRIVASTARTNRFIWIPCL